MKENWKRVLIGLLAVFLIGQIGVHYLPVYESSESDSLADVESHIFRFIVIAYVWSFIATAIGGFVARKNFLIPAIVYAAAEWIYGAVSGSLYAFELSQDMFQLDSSISSGDYIFSVLWSALAHLALVLAIAAVASAIGMKLSDSANLWSAPTR